MPRFRRGDVTLHYELDGEGTPAVYVSGLGSHSNDVLSQTIRREIAERYQVLAVDNQGSGQTVVGENSNATLEDIADDIAAVMDEQGMGASDILGISMGGCIAMMLAVRHPEKIRRLVVAVSLAHSEPRPNRTEFLLASTWEMRDRGIPSDLISRFTAVTLLSEDVFQQDWFINAWVNAPADPFAQTRAGFDLQTAAMETYDIREQIKSIQAPTLVMSSPDDMLVPPRLQDEIHSLIPNSEIKRYPGGHVFMLIPMYHAQFMEDVLAFWSQP
jgi:pimeloyl-ACP methyl ester carboxylesterase